jgi:hypothetical protein
MPTIYAFGHAQRQWLLISTESWPGRQGFFRRELIHVRTSFVVLRRGIGVIDMELLSVIRRWRFRGCFSIR